MSSNKLSMHDRRDLEKFTKFLALKCAQIIVQSRLGQKVDVKCKPLGTDWFNLAIQDIPEVYMEAKKALCEDIVSSSLPLCVEISLKTAEGDRMVLEMWNLGVFPDRCDHNVRVTHTIYNRMSMLLKSLLSISRTTPAYKLSRRQGADSYIICYRIFMGEPQVLNLGDNYKHLTVGQVPTPVGMIQLSVSYRTKMTISPTQTGRDSIMLKSDHFHTDLSPKHARYQKTHDNSKVSKDTTIIKQGAFADSTHIMKISDDADLDIPFSSLLIHPQTPSPSPSTIVPTVNSNTSGYVADSGNGNSPLSNENATIKCYSSNNSRRNSRNSITMTSACDGFIVVHHECPKTIEMPFNTQNSVETDLATFYKDCQCAPQLQAFSEEQTVAEQVGDLTKQLEAFETNMQQYADLLKSLNKSENNN
ncbi:hypothetical protein TKK_0018335 [Trichogramma kaykai]|uniref:Autophagy-related protein 13 n=1 Tax=Trichogramma kaykai TaxID=54128 RepID=A0ABD2VZ21_9HYME